MWFSAFRSYTYFIKLFYFYAIANSTVLNFSYFNCSLLVYRNTIKLCILTLHFVRILYLVVIFVDSLGLATYTIIPSTNKKFYLFPICISFISFSYLFEQNSIPYLSAQCWIKMEKEDILCLFLISRKKYLVFPHQVWF